MEIAEQVSKWVGILIIIVICIIIFLYLIDNATSGNLIKSITCGALYLIPLGSVTSALTQGCTAIPA